MCVGVCYADDPVTIATITALTFCFTVSSYYVTQFFGILYDVFIR